MPLLSKSKVLLAVGLLLGSAGAPFAAPDHGPSAQGLSALAFLGLGPLRAHAQPATPPGTSPDQPALLGKEWVYTVQPTDTLSRIATRHGIDLRRLLAINGLSTRKPIRAGQRIHLSNRHIAPPSEGATLVVNIPDRMLYRYDGASVVPYPVALGEPSDKDADDPMRWRTPIGSFKVVEKRANPVWNVPKSIQEEMRAKGKEVLTKVKPGPENPLGTRWIGLSAWGYGIHGTNAPTSIGRFSTHGCVRMRTEHVEEIFEVVAKGAVVRIIYEPAKVAVDGDAVYLEVSRDIYRRIPNMSAHVQRLLRDAGVADQVDPAHVRRVIKGRWGVATRIDRGAPAPFSTQEPQAKATPKPTPKPTPQPSPTLSPTPDPSPSPSPQETP